MDMLRRIREAPIVRRVLKYLCWFTLAIFGFLYRLFSATFRVLHRLHRALLKPLYWLLLAALVAFIAYFIYPTAILSTQLQTFPKIIRLYSAGLELGREMQTLDHTLSGYRILHSRLDTVLQTVRILREHADVGRDSGCMYHLDDLESSIRNADVVKGRFFKPVSYTHLTLPTKRIV